MSGHFAYPIIGIIIFFCFIELIKWHAKRRLMHLRCEPPDELFTTKTNRTFPKELLKAAERSEANDPTPQDSPPLIVGDECRLVHDVGPVMVVVEVNEREIIGSWDDGYQEHKFSRSIVRRHKPSDPVPARLKVVA